MNFTDMITSKFDNIKDSFDKLLNISDSKVFNDNEIHALNVELSKFKFTLNKCARGNITGPGTKKFVETFSKANYDLAKLPNHYKEELGRTYNELSMALKSNPSYFDDNKCATTYCQIYELFSGIKFKKFINRIQSSKFAEKFKKSNESILDPQSLENYLADLKLTGDSSFSEEGIFTPIYNGINGAKTAVINATGKLSTSINMAAIICIIMGIIISVLLIVLGTIYVRYISTLNEVLVKISDNSEDIAEAIKHSKQERIKYCAMRLDTDIPQATKTLLINPSKLSLRYTNNLVDKKYNQFDKLLSFAEKSTEGFELLIGGAILAGLIMLPSTLRCAMYWVQHSLINLDEILVEENQLLQNDLDDIDEKLNDPNTPKGEKDRLAKIKSKNINWMKTFSSVSESINKSFLLSNSDASQEMKADEKIDFEKGVTKEEERIAAVDTDKIDTDTSDSPSPDLDIPEESSPASINNPIIF